MRLENKIALITGGASGLGLATTERFVTEGCRVLVTDIQVEHGDELSNRFGSDVIFRRCDVTREEEVEAAFDFAEQELGPIDIVFHETAQCNSWRCPAGWCSKFHWTFSRGANRTRRANRALAFF